MTKVDAAMSFIGRYIMPVLGLPIALRAGQLLAGLSPRSLEPGIGYVIAVELVVAGWAFSTSALCWLARR